MNVEALRILLVDDDKEDYLIIRKTLDQIEYQTYDLSWEKTYEGGIKAIKEDDYDACLLDYRLDNHTGLEFLEEIKTWDSQVPVIILTGYEAYDIDLEVMKKGAADFLGKNQISPSLLERSLRYSIERNHYANELLKARDNLEETVKKRTHALETAKRDLEKEIEERKRAEKNSTRAKLEWERTFDAISDLIAVIDRNRRILRCNRALAEITGAPYHEIIGQQGSQWFPFMDDLACFCGEQGLSSPGKENSMEFNSEQLGGDFILNVSPVKDPDGVIMGSVLVARNISERKRFEAEREKLISELKEALKKVKTLSGLLPICASCKKIRDDKGYWNQIEAYITKHSDADFTHSICPDCAKRLYSDILPDSDT